MKQKPPSFANRLTKKVLVTVLIIMAVTLTMTFIAAYRAMRGETTGRYLGMMNVVSETILVEINGMDEGTNLSRELQRIDEECKRNGMRDIDWRFSHLDFYSFIIDKNGMYVAHPDSERVMKENILSHVSDNFYSDCKRTVQDMMQMKSGIAPMVVDDVWTDVYYTPIASTGWSLGMVVPKTALVTPMIILLFSLLSATGLGQILVWVICRREVRQATKPLVALTESSDEVAKGNFKAPLPELEYQDEISALRDSFATMQQSLVTYIRDLEETTTKKAAMENELNVARKIQMSMVPKMPPKLGGDRGMNERIDIWASMTPAKTVGGDLFDFFIRDDRLFFCIGDVSGKGVPAALMMTVVHYLFRSISVHFDQPDRIVEIMNDCLAADNKSLMFCTFLLGVLDLKTGVLKYCNAGHEAPYMIHSTIERMPVDSNMALGVMEGMSFSSQEIKLPEDTLLLLYTDGLTDATNPDGKLFGKERVDEVLRRALDDDIGNASEYIGRLTEEVAAYVKDAPQADDLTMLAIKIKH